MILPVTPIPVGSFGKVTVDALDQFGNVAQSEARSVEAVATGFAIGATTVNIQLGTGFFYITDQTIENVTISLIDVSNTGLNVASSQMVAFLGGSWHICFSPLP